LFNFSNPIEHRLFRRKRPDGFFVPACWGVKLGFDVAQSTARSGPPSQGWRTFLPNHTPDIAAMDLFIVPTIGFDLLYALFIVRLDRRGLVWINATANPTAE
jgi:hypothetical protein